MEGFVESPLKEAEMAAWRLALLEQMKQQLMERLHRNIENDIENLRSENIR